MGAPHLALSPQTSHVRPQICHLWTASFWTPLERGFADLLDLAC